MYEQFWNLCRSCMKNDVQYNLFSSEFEAKALAIIVEKYSGCKVSLEDQLPKFVCQPCYDQLIATHLFISKFNEVQILLHSCLEQNKETSYDEKSDTKEDIKFDLASSSITKEAPQPAENPETVLITFDPHTVKKEFCDEDSDIKNENDEISLEEQTINDVKSEAPTDLLDDKTRRDKKYGCNGCEKSFNFIQNLRRHCQKSGHDFVGTFNCNKCSKNFLTKKHFENHMGTHSEEKPFKCEQCSASFKFSFSLSRHMKLHTGEKSFFCEICGKGFIQKHNLNVHMRSHNGEEFTCDLCGKKYWLKSLLHQHMLIHETFNANNVVKGRKVKVECEVCKKVVTKGALYNHMKTHGEKFLCNICGKSYTTKFYLDVHMTIHSNDEKLFKCHLCSKSFPHLKYLRSHLRLHSDERPHCCKDCGRAFKYRNHLTRHLNIHTGVKPHSCKLCEKAFSTKECLTVHERVHTGEKPFLCSFCGRGFINYSNRNKHERVHRKNKAVDNK